MTLDRGVERRVRSIIDVSQVLTCLGISQTILGTALALHGLSENNSLETKAGIVVAGLSGAGFLMFSYMWLRKSINDLLYPKSQELILDSGVNARGRLSFSYKPSENPFEDENFQNNLERKFSDNYLRIDREKSGENLVRGELIAPDMTSLRFELIKNKELYDLNFCGDKYVLYSLGMALESLGFDLENKHKIKTIKPGKFPYFKRK